MNIKVEKSRQEDWRAWRCHSNESHQSDAKCERGGISEERLQEEKGSDLYVLGAREPVVEVAERRSVETSDSRAETRVARATDVILMATCSPHRLGQIEVGRTRRGAAAVGRLPPRSTHHYFIFIFI